MRWYLYVYSPAGARTRFVLWRAYGFQSVEDAFDFVARSSTKFPNGYAVVKTFGVPLGSFGFQLYNQVCDCCKFLIEQ